MGSELVISSASHFSFTEIFEKACPQYMAIGMSYDEFWNGEPEMAKYYREANALRQKEKDYDLWLQGRYIYDALCAVSPILHAFAKNGTEPADYLKEPYPRTMKDFKAMQERQMKENIENFRMFVNAKNEERRRNNERHD